MRMAGAALVLALMAGGCGQGTTADGGVADEAGPAADGVPGCEQVQPLSAPADWYRDEPIYVGNEMPVEELRAWAEDKPGFEELWIDRDHRGWVALAFSEQAELRQQELTEQFPDVGAVVVPVDWTMEELELLRDEVIGAFREEGIGSGIRPDTGIVTVEFAVLTDERRAAVAEQFGGRRVCVAGRDPSEVPSAGPQPEAGDGWRLLADEKRKGEAYRTWIATDDGSYAELWEEIGLTGPRPAVDFDREVVIWFGAVFGSSCPHLRLDDVVVDDGQALVHGEIVNVDPGVACTADANPHAYVVAVEREKLPTGPFRIQLGADHPPRGAPEEATYVDVDLSTPGAAAEADQVRSGRTSDLPPPEPGLRSGDYVETDYPFSYQMDVACGAEWLGVLNDVTWRAREPAQAQEVPPAWEPAVAEDGMVVVEVLIQTGSPPVATAELNEETLTYIPTDEAMPLCP